MDQSGFEYTPCGHSHGHTSLIGHHGIPVYYQILFNNGTATSAPLAEMSSQIPQPPVSKHPSPLLPLASDSSSSLLPPFLRVGSCITYKHDRTYHKGHLAQKACGTYCFSFKTLTAWTFPIYPSTKWTSVLRAFSFLDTSLIFSYA